MANYPLATVRAEQISRRLQNESNMAYTQEILLTVEFDANRHATTSLCNALLEDVVISVQRVSSSTWPLPFLLIVQRTALPYHTTMLQCLHASALLVVFSTVFTILLYVCIPVVCCCSCCCFVHAACFRCASGRRKSTAQQHSSQQVDMTSGAEWTEENDGMDEEEAMSWVEMQAMASSSDEEHL